MPNREQSDHRASEYPGPLLHRNFLLAGEAAVCCREQRQCELLDQQHGTEGRGLVHGLPWMPANGVLKCSLCCATANLWFPVRCGTHRECLPVCVSVTTSSYIQNKEIKQLF